MCKKETPDFQSSQTQFCGMQPGLVKDKKVSYDLIIVFVNETKINCRKFSVILFFERIKLLPAAEACNVFFSHETILSPFFFFVLFCFLLISPSLALICTKHIWSCLEIPEKIAVGLRCTNTHIHTFVYYRTRFKKCGVNNLSYTHTNTHAGPLWLR